MAGFEPGLFQPSSAQPNLWRDLTGCEISRCFNLESVSKLYIVLKVVDALSRSALTSHKSLCLKGFACGTMHRTCILVHLFTLDDHQEIQL